MLSRSVIFFFIALLTSVMVIYIYDTWRGPQEVIIREQTPNASWIRQQENYWPENSSAPRTAAQSPLESLPKNGFVSAAQKAAPAVVYLKSSKVPESESYGASYTSSSGSGVIVSPEGYVVTNHHVVEGGKHIELILNDRRVFKAQLIGSDPTTDIALLKIDAEQLNYLHFGNSDSLQVGEWVLAVGNPFRLQSTVTAGIVSAKGRDIDILDTQYGIESFIQTDAAVNQGNSGGALVNSEGALVGINTAIITYSGRYEGYSFAIPINLVRKVISDLKEFGTVHRGLLGIEARSVDDKIAQEFELSEVSGVYVFRVSPESGSDAAGLKSGDIILSINEQKVGTLPELMEYVGRYRPGDTVELEVWSNDKITKLRVELRNQLNTTDLVSIRKDKILTDLGFEVRDLILAEKKRTEQEGIKVVSIYRGSIIERTKMDPGFIITHINEERIDSSDDLVKALESIKGRVVFQGFYEQYQGPFWYVFTK